MAPSDDRKREVDGPIDAKDLPPRGHRVGREHDDHRKHENSDDERQPEMARDARDLNKEVGPFGLFICSAPRDVVREEVREERLGQMNRSTGRRRKRSCVCGAVSRHLMRNSIIQ